MIVDGRLTNDAGVDVRVSISWVDVGTPQLVDLRGSTVTNEAVQPGPYTFVTDDGDRRPVLVSRVTYTSAGVYPWTLTLTLRERAS